MSSRTPLITSVAVKRPLTWGFIVLLTVVIVLAIAASGLAWHSEKQHRKARGDLRQVSTELQAIQSGHDKVLAQQIEITRAQLQQQGTLDALLGNDALLRQRWQVARTHEAIALAEQYLNIRHDSQAAINLLQQAFNVISANEDPQLLAVRRALSQDIELIKALPQPDVSSLYQRLDGLRKAIAALDVPMPAMPATEPVRSPNGATVAERWHNFVQRVGQVTSDMVVLRRHDQSLPKLLENERRALAHEQLQLLLDQTQLMLLRHDEQMFRSLLVTLGQRLNANFAAVDIKAIQAELTSLQDAPIMVSAPSLNSRAAIDLVMIRAEGAK
ncbi:MAG: uroporphyrinogen-III C-methyltransferase [Moraxellaceae bacterium]|nr:uroporphyrinogen-III C-methyltransferase [Moraxellaceae bacterium]MDZ4386518.1 uroporphyrinogen-III C-methyltransferase [Moraxellaceae bacterium]